MLQGAHAHTVLPSRHICGVTHAALASVHQPEQCAGVRGHATALENMRRKMPCGNVFEAGPVIVFFFLILFKKHFFNALHN